MFDAIADAGLHRPMVGWPGDDAHGAVIEHDSLSHILDYHSSVEQAAQTATRGGVGTLVLTHYVPPMAPGAENEWRAIAAEHFSGTIELGDDLHRVVVGGES